MMRKRSLILALLIVVLVCGTVYSQSTAVVRRVLGKVEIQRPGEAWRPAEVGMELPLRATISTGFNSQAVLDVGGSVLTLRALTRIRIDELEVRENVAITGLSFPVGRVRAEVRTTEGLETDFRVRSPVSTAAVRGTTGEGTGDFWRVISHKFEVTNQKGLGVEVEEGGYIVMNGILYPIFGTQAFLLDFETPYLVPGADRRSRKYFGAPLEVQWGYVLINWTE